MSKKNAKKTPRRIPKTPQPGVRLELPATARTPKRKTTVERQVERLERQQELELKETQPDAYSDGIMAKIDPDQIDNVDYYGGTACAEWIESENEARGYLVVVMMYLWRCGKKPGQSAEKDLKKAKWFLQRLQLVAGGIVNDPLWIKLKDALFALGEKHGVNLYDETAEAS